MTTPIRVLIAEDQPVFRAALVDVVEEQAGLELVGTARDADEAIRLVRRHRPDVALLDVKMPEGGGPRAAREIRTSSPKTRVVALSAYDDRKSVLDMLRAQPGICSRTRRETRWRGRSSSPHEERPFFRDESPPKL